MNTRSISRPFSIAPSIAIMVLALAALAGCGSRVPTRDFNELIPRMMGAVKNTSPTQAAANLFNVTSADERRDAIAYLETKKYGHEPPYMRAYKILTTDPSPMVRAQAMRALGSSNDYGVLQYLIDGTTGKTGLADPDPEVRRDATQAMVHVFGDPAIPAVIDHLANDPDDQVRIGCARALRSGRGPVVYRALISALDDKNAAVVYWAHEALMDATRNRFDYDSKIWLTWYQQTYGQMNGAAGTNPATPG